jgi:hypothetical protein
MGDVRAINALVEEGRRRARLSRPRLLNEQPVRASRTWEAQLNRYRFPAVLEGVGAYQLTARVRTTGHSQDLPPAYKEYSTAPITETRPFGVVATMKTHDGSRPPAVVAERIREARAIPPRASIALSVKSRTAAIPASCPREGRGRSSSGPGGGNAARPGASVQWIDPNPLTGTQAGGPGRFFFSAYRRSEARRLGA